MWYVYIVATECENFYTGIAKDVARRFEEHLAVANGTGNLGAKYFRARKPKKVVYVNEVASRSEASKAEYAIKKLSKKQKLALIGSSEIALPSSDG